MAAAGDRARVCTDHFMCHSTFFFRPLPDQKKLPSMCSQMQTHRIIACLHTTAHSCTSTRNKNTTEMLINETHSFFWDVSPSSSHRHRHAHKPKRTQTHTRVRTNVHKRVQIHTDLAQLHDRRRGGGCAGSRQHWLAGGCRTRWSLLVVCLFGASE